MTVQEDLGFRRLGFVSPCSWTVLSSRTSELSRSHHPRPGPLTTPPKLSGAPAHGGMASPVARHGAGAGDSNPWLASRDEQHSASPFTPLEFLLPARVKERLSPIAHAMAPRTVEEITSRLDLAASKRKRHQEERARAASKMKKPPLDGFSSRASGPSLQAWARKLEEAESRRGGRLRSTRAAAAARVRRAKTLALSRKAQEQAQCEARRLELEGRLWRARWRRWEVFNQRASPARLPSPPPGAPPFLPGHRDALARLARSQSARTMQHAWRSFAASRRSTRYQEESSQPQFATNSRPEYLLAFPPGTPVHATSGRNLIASADPRSFIKYI
mmetsp:Transcript_17549/g.56599  ORF Transcript_17549/g.56599 Transcript_17549/m.56599 type:complete len:331 (-) Transcript_17549:24-1016(-)